MCQKYGKKVDRRESKWQMEQGDEAKMCAKILVFAIAIQKGKGWGCPCCCRIYKRVGAFAVACLTSLRSSNLLQTFVSLPYVHSYVPPIDYTSPSACLTSLRSSNWLQTSVSLPFILPFRQLITNLRQLAFHPSVPPIVYKSPSACLSSLRSSNWSQTSVSLPFILPFRQLITNLLFGNCSSQPPHLIEKLPQWLSGPTLVTPAAESHRIPNRIKQCSTRCNFIQL